MKLIRTATILVIIAVAAIGCSSQSESKHMTISVQEAKQLIDKGAVEIIDVRTEEEFQTGHIPGAKLLSLQELEQRLEELDREQPYLLVCRSGNRSSQAQNLLRNNGFNETYNMDKGMNDWIFEIVK